jgi:hypothetical protein
MDKPIRLDIMPSRDLRDAIDRWRRQQPDLPPRAEAARRLIEAGLKAESRKKERPDG